MSASPSTKRRPATMSRSVSKAIIQRARCSDCSATIRPILRSPPELRELYQQEESFLGGWEGVAMWTWLARLIGGPAITGLISAYKAKLDAANTQDRIAADLASKEIEGRDRREKAGVCNHHRRARPMVHRHHPASARLPNHHLLLEGDRVGQGARVRRYRSDHRNDCRLDRHDRHRLCRWPNDRKGRAHFQAVTRCLADGCAISAENQSQRRAPPERATPAKRSCHAQ